MSQQGEEVGKLFVGGLSWETTQESLCRFFSRFGEVIDCVVMKNNETGRSRGFGFVTFKDPGCVQIVLSSGPHNLDGRTIDPKACNPRSMQKASGDHKQGGGGGGGSGGAGPYVPKSKSNNPKIFLGGLPSNITETDLRNFFGKYGKVLEVVIMYDQEKKRSRGFGFLSFETEDSVEQVCAEHYVNISGKQVECKKAEPRDGPRTMGSKGGGQWNGTNMGMGMPPHMGGPMGGPGMGPPMGPMANGMAMGGGYQAGGWGGPQQAGYGQGYGAPPQSPGYQGWGAPSGYGPYGTPAAQYSTSPQGGFGGFDMGPPTAYPGFGWGAPAAASPAGPMAAIPSAGAGSVGGSGTVGSADPFGQSQTGMAATNSGVANVPSTTPGVTSSTSTASQSGVKQEYNSFGSAYGSMGSYPQEASSYGPSRSPYGNDRSNDNGVGKDGGNAHSVGYNTTGGHPTTGQAFPSDEYVSPRPQYSNRNRSRMRGFGQNDGSQNSNYGGSQGSNYRSTQSQGYHPYRRQ